MPRTPINDLDKLVSLEKKIQNLIEKRKVKLMEIIVSCNALTVEDTLFAGFLLFAQDPINKNNSILKEFRELAIANKIPSKPRQPNNKRTQKNN